MEYRAARGILKGCPLIRVRGRGVDRRTHGEGELTGGKGLLEECHVRLYDAPADDLVVRVSGHVKHGNVRTRDAQVLDELSATHQRHHHVGDDKTERTAMVEHQRQSLPAARGAEHAIPFAFERANEQLDENLADGEAPAEITRRREELEKSHNDQLETRKRLVPVVRSFSVRGWVDFLLAPIYGAAVACVLLYQLICELA